MTDTEFSKGIYDLARAYPTFPLSRETIDVYEEKLSNLPPGDFSLAVAKIIDESRFFPTIADIKAELKKLRRLRSQSALEVWEGLRGCIVRGITPDFLPGSPVKRALEFLGGWEAFKMVKTDELPRRFKDFERLYNECLDREEGQRQIAGQAQKQIEGPKEEG